MSERQTVKKLICGGLGYCCEWAFFQMYKRTELIALRLGTTPRAIRYHKAAFKRGEYKCEHEENCLRARLFKRSSNPPSASS